MKKLLTIVAILAIVAAMVVPVAVFADDVNVSGNVLAVPTVLNMITPSPISLWSLSAWNNNDYLRAGTNFASSVTPGSVTYTQGNDGVTGWGLTVACAPGYVGPTTAGQMYLAGNWLPNALAISPDGSAWTWAASGFGYSGTSDGITPLNLYAQQVVGTTDPPGVYSIVLVYTLTPTH